MKRKSLDAQETAWADYPFPLRPNFTATFVLPTDLTMQETQRLRSFLMSVAVDGSAEEVAQP